MSDNKKFIRHTSGSNQKHGQSPLPKVNRRKGNMALDVQASANRQLKTQVVPDAVVVVKGDNQTRNHELSVQIQIEPNPLSYQENKSPEVQIRTTGMDCGTVDQLLFTDQYQEVQPVGGSIGFAAGMMENLTGSVTHSPSTDLKWVGNLTYPSDDAPQDYFIDDLVGTRGRIPADNQLIIPVNFISCVSPEEIYVRPLDYESKFQVLQSEMQRAYHQVDIPKDFRFDVGLLCAVRVHRLWIRAIVTDIDGTFCIVQSYDTGTEYRVTVDDIFPLKQPFDSFQMLRCKISLTSIYPVHGSWLPHVSHRITCILASAHLILVDLDEVQGVQNGALSCQVIYEHEQPSGPLQIGGKIAVNLGEQLVAEKLALDRPRPLTIHLPTARAWPAPHPTTSLPDEFMARITWLTMDGAVSLYNEDRSERILSEMSHFFGKTYANSQPSELDLQCHKGDLCVAKYPSDGQWYRGTVLAIGERPNTVSVLFVDYGTEEYVDHRDIRKRVHFEDVPVQVVKCFIDNIRPPGFCKGDSFAWSAKTLDQVHALIIDTRCWVTVRSTNPLVASMMTVDGNDVADLLVESGLAELDDPLKKRF